jgi:hypothetical protein
MSETWLIKPLRQYPKSESCHLDFIENDFAENYFAENVDFIENMTHLLTT